MSGARDKYLMLLPSYSSWLQRRQFKPPEADRLVPIVSHAGPSGMTRGQIGSVIGLERNVLDQLLDGLVRFGLLVVSDEDGLQVFRAAHPSVTGR